jgi:hypothetical protein
MVSVRVPGHGARSRSTGTATLQNLLDGLAFWALLACLAGVVVGAAVWAWASHSNNHHYSAQPRWLTAVFGAGLASGTPVRARPSPADENCREDGNAHPRKRGHGRGRRGLAVCACAALAIGAAGAIINFFADAGSKVR